MIVLYLELATLATVLALALVLPRRGRRLARRLDAALTHLARRPVAAAVLLGLLAFAGSAAYATLVRWPEPRIHDEFSYLLGADTFAGGRLTNPTHPMWPHFETYHVIQRPSYASKYPPGQALMLALGTMVGGHPAVGLWIGAGLLGAALFWMLYAWFPPRWALVGGLVAVLRFGLFSYWSQSYWGGAVAALGGALLFGALPRVLRDARPRDSLLLGVGLVVLAYSRPLEGLVASIPAAVVLLMWMVRRGWTVLPRVVLPILAVLALGAIGMAGHNAAVTGSVLRTPYGVHGETYDSVPLFLWSEKPPAPEYRHPMMQKFWTEEVAPHYDRPRTPRAFLAECWNRARGMRAFYLGYALLLPLLMLPWVLRKARMRFAALTCALVAGTLCVTTYCLAHYAAPLTGLGLVLLVAGLRHLNAVRLRGWRAGRWFVPALLCAGAVLLVFQAGRGLRAPDSFAVQRARTLERLEAAGGRHLVIVRYGPGHAAGNEWVYNRADLDGATVVWARDMGDERNRRLIEHFSGHSVWSAEIDSSLRKLSIRSLADDSFLTAP